MPCLMSQTVPVPDVLSIGNTCSQLVAQEHRNCHAQFLEFEGTIDA